MSVDSIRFPQQKLPHNKKTKKWRKSHLDWADNNSYLYNTHVRSSIRHKTINYDLWNNVVHIDDMKKVLNPSDKKIGLIPKDIQHYPIVNNPINVLIGEEAKRKHNFFIKVTNDDAISSIEEGKINSIRNKIVEMVTTSDKSDEEIDKELDTYEQFFTYEYQDLRELRANHLARHYMKELDFDMKMTQGFKDVNIVGEEIYQFDIDHGEPTMDVLNPKKVYTLRSGYSSKIEDADLIILDDYWSPGKVLDKYHDKLTEKDQKYIENISNQSFSKVDEMDNYDERNNFIYKPFIDSSVTGNTVDDFIWLGESSAGLPHSRYIDSVGNIRVLRIYWKSKRKVKQVKSYNPITGEEEFNIYDESYVIDKDKGEEEKIWWINEIWEGTKIGEEVYVDMRPKEVQYNRLNNPSRCHAGIIGQIYNTNESTPVSMLDRMKALQYTYNAVHLKLNKLLAKNKGKIHRLDLAKIPNGWSIEKLMYFAELDGFMVEDSFKEGNKGSATGKLAGAFNTTGGSIDLDLSQSISFHIQLLDSLKNECWEMSGVTKQRQGQVSNRETVGGIERSVEQSSHITEEIFSIHDNVRKRCIETLIETSKMALKGGNKKIPFITDDRLAGYLDIDGDEYAECDYGIVVDNDLSNVELKQKLDQLAFAWAQNDVVKPGTILEALTNPSLSAIKRMLDKDIRENREEQARQFDAQQQQMQQQLQQQQAVEQAKMEQEDRINVRDNQTKILLEQMKQANQPIDVEDNSLEVDKLDLQKEKVDKDFKIKEDQLAETIRHNKQQEQISKKSKTSK